ncbi:MAG: GtrA family protein [Bacteroides sp.]|nr:GtrA family protein [Bacteroides sp.]
MRTRYLTNKIFIIPTNNTLIQLFRYLFVGGFAFVIDFSLLYVLVECFYLHYLLSATISFICGLFINYLISIKWVFQRNKRNKIIEFISFSLIGVVGLLINNLFIWIFTEYIHIYYMISKLLTASIVVLWNFFARKYLLFSSK